MNNIHNPDYQLSQWFIMTSSDPQRIEEEFIRENLNREDEEPYRTFIPGCFMQSGQSLNGTVTEIEASLRRFVFVRSSVSRLQKLLTVHCGRFKDLWFYRNKQRSCITVPDAEMDLFIRYCSDTMLHYSLWPLTDDLKDKDEVVLLHHPMFQGRRLKVLGSKHTKDGIRLTVATELFGHSMSMVIEDIRPEDVAQCLDSDSIRLDKRLLQQVKYNIKAILERMTSAGYTDDSRRKDATQLEHLYNYRFRTFGNARSRRHFLAMMLVCARLRGDHQAVEQLAKKALEEIEQLNAEAESRKKGTSPSDALPYLQAALALATGDAASRNAAKEYVQQYNPKSETLCLLVKVCRKKMDKIKIECSHRAKMG